jgi:hypothetical protein
LYACKNSGHGVFFYVPIKVKIICFIRHEV